MKAKTAGFLATAALFAAPAYAQDAINIPQPPRFSRDTFVADMQRAESVGASYPASSPVSKDEKRDPFYKDVRFWVDIGALEASEIYKFRKCNQGILHGEYDGLDPNFARHLPGNLEDYNPVVDLPTGCGKRLAAGTALNVGIATLAYWLRGSEVWILRRAGDTLSWFKVGYNIANGISNGKIAERVRDEHRQFTIRFSFGGN